MKKWFSIKRIALVVLLTAVILTGFTLYNSKANSKKYSDPAFKEYIKHRQYCDAFWGGSHASKEEMYKDWKNNTEYGC